MKILLRMFKIAKSKIKIIMNNFSTYKTLIHEINFQETYPEAQVYTSSSIWF